MLTWQAQLAGFPLNTLNADYTSTNYTSASALRLDGHTKKDRKNSSDEVCETDMRGLIQNLSSRLGFDLDETFDRARRSSTSAPSDASKTPKAPKRASSLSSASSAASNLPRRRHTFVVRVPHRPATITTDTSTTSTSTTTGTTKRARKVSFADEEAPEMVSDRESEDESESEPVFPDSRHVRIRDQDEEDNITIEPSSS